MWKLCPLKFHVDKCLTQTTLDSPGVVESFTKGVSSYAIWTNLKFVHVMCPCDEAKSTKYLHISLRGNFFVFVIRHYDGTQFHIICLCTGTKLFQCITWGRTNGLPSVIRHFACVTCTGFWMQKSRNEKMGNNNQEGTPDRNHDSQKLLEECKSVS